MTCRDFKHYVASFSLPELAQTQMQIEDPQMVGHTQACPACESWLQGRRSLNASLHTLRARTAGREAGPDVERALLQVFRQGIPAGRTSLATAQAAVATGPMPSGVTETWKMWRPQSEATPRSTPLALRLSRLFELGAYAAVAAAIAIAIFLGIHLLQHGSNTKPIQGKSAPERSVPVIQQPMVIASGPDAVTSGAGDSHTLRSKQREMRVSHRVFARQSSLPQSVIASAGSPAVADDSQSDTEAGYMALMLCDPLSCASETQVVRMELPESAEADQAAQPRIADVVVGYDGVVRAVRFEN